MPPCTDLSPRVRSLSDHTFAVLIGAGYDTTKNQLNLIMKMLIDHPQEQEKIEGDPKRVKRLINESLRLRNAIGCLHRLNDVDIEYRDVLIPTNTFMSFPVTFYGRDSDHASDPHRFDPGRSDAPPVLAFVHTVCKVG